MKNLSYKNIQVSNENSNLKVVNGALPYPSIENLFDINWERPVFKYVSEEGEVLATAKCINYNAIEYNKYIFSGKILEDEINYTFTDVLSSEERKITDNMPLNEYIKYIKENYPEESETLELLWKQHLKLKDFEKKDLFFNAIYIDFIESFKDGYGAGTLIVNALKEKYSAIFLYSGSESEAYWKNKHNFREILNGHMYWSENEELNKILG